MAASAHQRRSRSARAPTVRVPEAPLWRGPLVAELALASRAAAFSAPGWLFELKYDGFRLLAAKDGSAVTLRYRSGRDVTAHFPEVVEAIASLPAARALLDGELVVFGRDGRSDFALLRARALRRRTLPGDRAHARACLFDVLALDDRDLRPLPLVARKDVLKALLANQSDAVLVEHVEARGEELLCGARELGLEGVVAKRADSPYVAGRTTAWLKIKNEHTADFVVIGIAEPAEGTFWRPGLVLAVVDRNAVRYVGRVAVGAAELATLDGVLPMLRQERAPCSGAGPALTWLAPAVVCEVRFLASSGRGLRHARFLRFRTDKPWRECGGAR